MHFGTLGRARLLRAIGACALAGAIAGRALALQPLETFLAAAQERNPDALEASANVVQQRAQADIALGRQLPGLSARGSHLRNEYETSLDLTLPGGPTQRLVIQPRDQTVGTVTLTIPLLDLAGFRRVSAARTGARAAGYQLEATRLAVQGQVVQSYHQLLANRALLAASRKALEFSRENLRITEDRYQAGSAAVLDVERARADAEQQVQQVASAGLQIELAARALQSASGVSPDLSGDVALDDDLRGEPPLDEFDRDLGALPAVAAATSSTRAAEQQAEAQRLALLPSLAGSVTESYTDTGGPGGHELSYQGVLSVVWTFDLTSVAAIRAQDAAAEAARARELRATLEASDAIHREWNTVLANLARSRSARAQQSASAHAAELARDRYRAGAATQLDLLQAQRDAFGADVARIQADADLVNARAQLRLASGKSLTPHLERKDVP